MWGLCVYMYKTSGRISPHHPEGLNGQKSERELCFFLYAILICLHFFQWALIAFIIKNNFYWWLRQWIHQQYRRPRFNPWVRKIPWRREWLPLQYSCLESSMDTGVWWTTVQGVGKNWTWLKLNIQKTKIVASAPITLWQIDGETVETVADFIFEGLQNHCRWWLQPWN